jgi:hypothetical protein
MPRNPDVSRRDQDEPNGFGRLIIAGTVAGVIASFGFVNLHGYSDDSNALWSDRAPQGHTLQLDSGTDPSLGSKVRAPDPKSTRDPSFVPPEGEPAPIENNDPNPKDYDPNDDGEPAR